MHFADMATSKSARYVATEQQEEYDEDADFASFEEPAVDYVAAVEPRCAHCGELLAWHEQACAATPAPEAAAPRHFAPAAPTRTIVWRGQLRERHPQTGLVHRVPVYRLDDGYWDCYREEELRVA
jgi:hypothetical protein